MDFFTSGRDDCPINSNTHTLLYEQYKKGESKPTNLSSFMYIALMLLEHGKININLKAHSHTL